MQGIDWAGLINSLIDKILSFLLGAVGGLVAARITYHFGLKRDLKRIETQFQQELLRYREKQSRDALDGVWTRVQDALHQVRVVTSRFKSYPDLNHLPPEAIEEFLKTSGFSEFHKQEILRAPDKSEYYRNICFWYNLDEARKRLSDLDAYVRRNSIYLEAELKDALQTVIELLDGVLTAYKIWRQGPEPTLFKEAHSKREQAEALVDSLEHRIQRTLAHKENAAA